jgi:hypothetical protein
MACIRCPGASCAQCAPQFAGDGVQKRVADLEREVADLKAKLARHDGSRFDLGLDSAVDIGRALADNVSESKAASIFKAARERYKQKKQRPAG